MSRRTRSRALGGRGGAYVLGALPEDEREAFEAHLASCPACRAEVDELRRAADALPLAVAAVDAAARAEGADHGRGRARGRAARRRRPGAPTAPPAPRAGAALPPLLVRAARLPAARRRPRCSWSLGVAIGIGARSSAASEHAHGPAQVDDRAGAARARPSSRSTTTARRSSRSGLPAAADGPRLPGVAQARGPGARADARAVHAEPRRLGHRVGARARSTASTQVLVTAEPRRRLAHARRGDLLLVAERRPDA